MAKLFGLPSAGDLALVENPVNFFEFFTDYTASNALVSSVSGVGAAQNFGAVESDTSSIGWVQSQTGTDTTGRSGYQSQTMSFRFDQGILFLETKIVIPTLSDGTETFTFLGGFADAVTTSIVDGAFFRYTHSVNSGKFEAVTRSNSVETAADTGITVVAGTAYKLTIIGTSTSVAFYINGALVATITTNIPSGSGRATGTYVGINKSAGTTSRNLNHDYFWLKINIPAR